MLSLENLHVYKKALQLASRSAALCSTWDKRHAIVDHLAAESIVLNVVEAARLRALNTRLVTIDYWIGSSLECAGCLDIAQIKQLVQEPECSERKQQLCAMTGMLVGLRKGWNEAALHEEPTAYSAEPDSSRPLFHHESLDVYQAASSFTEWFEARAATKELSKRAFRQIDEAATGIVLNIAEGNGRYAELDQHRFLDIAQSAAVKTAAYLDLSIHEEASLQAKIARQGRRSFDE